MNFSLEEYLPPKDLWPALVIPDEFAGLPEDLNLTEALLDRHLREGRADRTAIYIDERRITYGEIASHVNRLGNGLLRIGVNARDRVGIRLTNLPQAIIANFAILKIGAIPVPISPLWSRREILYVGQDASLKALVVSRSLLREVHEAKDRLPSLKVCIVIGDTPRGEGIRGEGYYDFEELVASGREDLEPFRLKRDDVAILLYTSGTTGMPKGCCHTVAGVLIESSLITKYVWDLGECDVLAGSAPISFAAGFGTFALIPFTTRGAISLLPKFSPKALMENIAGHRVTVLTGIPTAYRKLLDMEGFERYDLGGLRLCTSGGDALGEETFDAWLAKTGMPIWENMGTTELFNIIVSNRMGDKPKRSSVGLPLKGFSIQVMDDNGDPCPPGKIGSIYVKGPTGTIYWNPRGHGGRLMKAQRSCVRDGWSRMGDAVYMDDEGYLFFVSREDDMIKSAGYRLSPLEIEEVLNRHPLIQEAAVVGVPDPILGQRIKAFVALNQRASSPPNLEEEIKDYCQRNIATYKIPRIFEFVARLPKTSTGKIIRRKLLHSSSAPFSAPVSGESQNRREKK